ncbi:MAG: DUF952 domain-containing protein [Chloroflexi bacterium]|nr:DUF952 domain-containing protein [Chloroflexota bacterium]
MTTIYHIVPRGIWAQAQQTGEYRGDTLEAEGFIHFSTRDQVLMVANARFKRHTGLQLLAVAADRLTAELKYEPPYENAEGGELFPHLYGALNLDAVVRVVDFEPEPDGTFRLPADL